ncbi:putative Darpin-darpin Rigid Fusion [Paratrimastix pyriformis]|uniref:Darpin-darpin Rigid Fusion n=1 Tax=Paratrimastix pyriformis TaxID=342808 RepID=A0ABQ8UWI5_9EUKA|nr:putative Darpin-darpin Rigid Fusion [Paratrimastix pyriformis]
MWAQLLMQPPVQAEEFRRFFKDRPETIEEKDLRGWTPLQCAVEASDPELADTLLQLGADVHTIGAGGETLLHRAVRVPFTAKSLDILGLILKAGVQPNLPDGAGETPLHLAALAGCAPYISTLLAEGADPCVTENALGWTPLHHAVAAGSQEAVEALCAHSPALLLAIGDREGRTPLHYLGAGAPQALAFLRGVLSAEEHALSDLPARVAEWLADDVARLPPAPPPAPDQERESWRDKRADQAPPSFAAIVAACPKLGSLPEGIATGERDTTGRGTMGPLWRLHRLEELLARRPMHVTAGGALTMGDPVGEEAPVPPPSVPLLAGEALEAAMQRDVAMAQAVLLYAPDDDAQPDPGTPPPAVATWPDTGASQEPASPADSDLRSLFFRSPQRPPPSAPLAALAEAPPLSPPFGRHPAEGAPNRSPASPAIMVMGQPFSLSAMARTGPSGGSPAAPHDPPATPARPTPGGDPPVPCPVPSPLGSPVASPPPHSSPSPSPSVVERRALSRTALVNQADAHGHTALHLAALRGHLDMAQLLLAQGAAIDGPFFGGAADAAAASAAAAAAAAPTEEQLRAPTPLCIALLGTLPEMVRLLVARGAALVVPRWMVAGLLGLAHPDGPAASPAAGAVGSPAPGDPDTLAPEPPALSDPLSEASLAQQRRAARLQQQQQAGPAVLHSEGPADRPAPWWRQGVPALARLGGDLGRGVSVLHLVAATGDVAMLAVLTAALGLDPPAADRAAAEPQEGNGPQEPSGRQGAESTSPQPSSPSPSPSPSTAADRPADDGEGEGLPPGASVLDSPRPPARTRPASSSLVAPEPRLPTTPEDDDQAEGRASPAVGAVAQGNSEDGAAHADHGAPLAGPPSRRLDQAVRIITSFLFEADPAPLALAAWGGHALCCEHLVELEARCIRHLLGPDAAPAPAPSAVEGAFSDAKQPAVAGSEAEAPPLLAGPLFGALLAGVPGLAARLAEAVMPSSLSCCPPVGPGQEPAAGTTTEAFVLSPRAALARALRALTVPGLLGLPGGRQGHTAAHLAAWRGQGPVMAALIEAARLSFVAQAVATAEQRVDGSAPQEDQQQQQQDDLRAIQSRVAGLFDATDKDGATPLHLAARSPEGGAAEIVPLLLQAGALVDKRDRTGSTVLHYAAAQAALGPDLLQELLCRARDPNIPDAHMATPLHRACATGRWATAEAFLQAGAMARPPDAHGETPLHLVARNGPASLIAALVAHGASPDFANETGQSALHIAATRGRHRAVERLLELGADPNAQDAIRWTPLHYACVPAEPHPRVIRALILAGANTLVFAPDGTLPLGMLSNPSYRDQAEELARHIEARVVAAPPVAPESEAQACKRCGQSFSFLSRKTGCRACGQIFCRACCEGEAPLHVFGLAKPVRLCVGCMKVAAASVRLAEQRIGLGLPLRAPLIPGLATASGGPGAEGRLPLALNPHASAAQAQEERLLSLLDHRVLVRERPHIRHPPTQLLLLLPGLH